MVSEIWFEYYIYNIQIWDLIWVKFFSDYENEFKFFRETQISEFSQLWEKTQIFE